MVFAATALDNTPEPEARPLTRTIQIRNFPESEYEHLRREVLQRRAEGESVTFADVVVAALADRRRRGTRAITK